MEPLVRCVLECSLTFTVSILLHYQSEGHRRHGLSPSNVAISCYHIYSGDLGDRGILSLAG